MAVTRIKTNQITAGAVHTASLADNVITSGKLADDLTYGSNLTVSGNLTVNGTTTTVDTVNTTIDDPILLLGANQTGAGAVDLGILGERGDNTNVFVGYDENGMGYRLLQLPSFKICRSLHVRFVEDYFPCLTKLPRTVSNRTFLDDI